MENTTLWGASRFVLSAKYYPRKEIEDEKMGGERGTYGGEGVHTQNFGWHVRRIDASWEVQA